MVVDVVGANPMEHASYEFGIIKLISDALIRSLSEFEEIPIIEIEFFFQREKYLTFSRLEKTKEELIKL